MSTILDTIADYARIRVEADRARLSLEELKALAMAGTPADGQAFYDAVAKPDAIATVLKIAVVSTSRPPPLKQSRCAPGPRPR